MLTKVFAGVVAAPLLIAILRLQGATPSLQSPMLLADLCGLLAIAAMVIALCSPDSPRRTDGEERRALSVPPAARQPRSPNM
jgi:hypothetical protein